MRDTYTLVFRAQGLSTPGLPVYYRNPAIPDSVGHGVLVPTPPDEEDEEMFLWWAGTLTETSDPMMRAFTNLVGPELGLAGGLYVRMTPAYLLEVDFTQVEARRRVLDWCALHEDIGGLTVDSPADEIAALCWRLVGERYPHPDAG